MQLNALIDMLEMLLPGLQKIGEANPTRELVDGYDLFTALRFAGWQITDDSQLVAVNHINEFIKMIEASHE